MTCEMPEVFREIKRKARKEHKCCECSRTIKRGDTYSYVSGIWGGSPASYKTCNNCTNIRQLTLIKYPPFCDDKGPAFGELREYIREMNGADCRKWGRRKRRIRDEANMEISDKHNK